MVRTVLLTSESLEQRNDFSRTSYPRNNGDVHINSYQPSEKLVPENGGSQADFLPF
ncbi:hypothetical protein [Vibrio vulnificus]|uniref:hypothetical protein n=1 Tax=Vibrio vulnificus TaxID=672 RepID=UPI001865843D|nr:hypothetical protein [Vibrio vulnificus]EGR7942952.1 hypothetical protein [Vibrio vulnificus]